MGSLWRIGWMEFSVPLCSMMGSSQVYESIADTTSEPRFIVSKLPLLKRPD